MTDELDPKAFYLWEITDERTGKRRRTSYRMQPATALERHPDATPDLASKELRTYIGNAADLGRGSAPPASALPPSGDAPEESEGR